jgi:predicted lipoprotein with Yx(FWY)xxD motif
MVLKNSAGLTLYYFTPDSASTVACTGQCASLWPPLLSNSDTPTASSSLPGHLTVVAGGNGKQVEYNGHPLYTYSKDSGPSDANGQGLFGKWFVATPSLAMSAVASATPSASKSSTYNPYGG